MFKMDALVKRWTPKLSKKFSPVRNLMFLTLEVLVAVYFHVPKEKKSKLDASGKKGTFVGYSETSKAYRIYVPGQREVEISHDVTFDEDTALGKISNLRLPRKNKKADSGK